jgi:hypothetical protein
MRLARDNQALLVLNPEHVNLAYEGPMDIEPNGCTCRFLHPGQVCIACRGRAKSEQKCSKCNVGLLSDDEIAWHKCSNCYYEEIDKYTYRP